MTAPMHPRIQPSARMHCTHCQTGWSGDDRCWSCGRPGTHGDFWRLIRDQTKAAEG